LGGFGYFAMKQVLEEAKPEVIEEINKTYDKYVEDGVIPDEHRPLYDELHEIGTDETSSLQAILMCLVAIEASLEDGEVTEKEIQLATEVRDFVKENPQVGWIGMGTFFGEHPEFEEAFNEAQQEFGVPSEPGATEDEGMEGPPEPEVTPEEAPAEPGS
jgi:hypothetical protein